MKIIGIIPARYKSSRFLGKPLMNILGKPMIWWVYNNAKKVKELDEVYVATESDLIVKKCNELGINVIMTSDKHLTGTDRVGEVSRKIKGDIYAVLMGDEPLIKPEEVSLVINAMLNDNKISTCMLATKFKNPIDVVNSTTIKLAINDNDDLIFMSRSPIPYPKEILSYNFYKNIGLYAYTKKALNFFIKTKPGNIELAEGLEMLRFIENKKSVKVVKVDSDSMSVDTPKDLIRVENILKSRKESDER